MRFVKLPNPKALRVFVGALAIGFAILLYHLANTPLSQSRPTSPRPHSPEIDEPGSKGAPTHNASTVSQSGTERNAVRPLSANDTQLIDVRTNALREKLASIERAHFRLKSKREVKYYTIAAGVVTPPSPDEMEDIYREITKGLESFNGNEALESKYRKSAERLLREYTHYRKPYKVLIGYIGKTGPGTFIELYADDEDSRLPDEEGHWRIDTDTDHYRMDEQWGKEGSWTAKRYGSLISVDDLMAK